MASYFSAKRHRKKKSIAYYPSISIRQVYEVDFPF